MKYCFLLQDNLDVYRLAEVIEFDDIVNGECKLRILESNSIPDSTDHLPPVTVSKGLIVPIKSIKELLNPPSDLIKLVQVDRSSILYTLSCRFQKDLIYTSIGPILVAINPFKWTIGVYGKDIMASFQAGKRNLSDDPHVFAIAQDAYSDLHLRKSQSIIISGESGAGKTEATKQCLNQLAFVAGSSSGIQGKVLKASPILEAWGNAKTLRNNNSSRFGKFIEVWFDKQGDSFAIVGSSNTTYILEKSRVVFQETGERNYHVFYQLIKGGSKEFLDECKLSNIALNPSICRYINQSGCIEIEDVDDAADYNETAVAFSQLGFSSEEHKLLYKIVAGILHLANIMFETHPEKTEESVIRQNDLQWLANASELLGVEPHLLKQAFLFKKIVSGGRRSSIVYSAYLPMAAEENKNAMAKEIYNRCFDWIVLRINELMESNDEKAPDSCFKSISTSNSASKTDMIGILDIFGFEIFPKNSFEQLCINLANEALQQHFNFNIFQAEMNIYLAEDVPVPALNYVDNQDVLDLIVKRPKGLIPMLDEEGIIPRGSWDSFLRKLYKQHSTHPRFKAVKTSGGLSTKNSQSSIGGVSSKTSSVVARDNQYEFGILHYAGEVYYDAQLFLMKNKDTLSQDIVEVLATSENSVLKALFESTPPSSGAESGNNSPVPYESIKSFEHAAPQSQKRSSVIIPAASDSKLTVGRKFSQQLEGLIANLNSTQPRYIRCIKPNQEKKPNIFVARLANEQLTYSGVFEAVIIMQNGYPFRLAHKEFRDHYHMLVRTNAGKVLLFDDEAFQSYSSNPLQYNENIYLKKHRHANQLSPFSREQCQLMVTLMTQSTGCTELSRCFVGISKTFYQSHENRLLGNPRKKIMDEGCVTIQRVSRGRLCRHLLRDIIRAETDCIQAFEERNVTVLQRYGQNISSIVTKFELYFRLQYKTVALTSINGFTAALLLESQMLKKIEELLGSSMSLIDLYEELDDAVKEVKKMDYTTQFGGKCFSLNYQSNKMLVQHIQKIEIIGVSASIKKMFERGIAEDNELILEKAIADLSAAKEIDELVYDFKEIRMKAEKIIEGAVGSLHRFVGDLMVAIQKGKVVLKEKPSKDPNSKNKLFDIVVDATPLSEILIGCENHKYANSKRVEQLIVLSYKLRDLRRAVQEQDWSNVWNKIRADWNHIFVQSAAKTLALSNEVETAVAAEIQDICIAAVQNFLLPSLSDCLSRNAIPTQPVFTQIFAPIKIIDTTELTQELIYAEQYSEYFDNPTTFVFHVTKEHLKLREAVNLGDISAIISSLQSCADMSPSQDDFVNAKKYEALHSVYDGIVTALTKGRAVGDPGSIDFSSIDSTQLQSKIAAAHSMNMSDDLWNSFIYFADCVHNLRVSLRDDFIKNSLHFLDSDSHFDELARVNVETSSLFAKFTPLVNVAIAISDEVATYQREVLHHRTLGRLVDLTLEGRIRGSVGQLDTTSIDCIRLLSELEAAHSSQHLIFNSITTKWESDIKFLLGVRELILNDNWQGVEDLTESSSFSDLMTSCHSSILSELEIIRDEVCDIIIRRKLTDCMSVPFGNANKGDESNHVQTLRIIIENAEKIERTSLSTIDMIFTGKIIFSLYRAMDLNRWEPTTEFFFGQSDGEDLFDVCTSNISYEAAASIVKKLSGHLEPHNFNNSLDYKAYNLSENLTVFEILQSCGYVDDQECGAFRSEEARKRLKEIMDIYVDRKCRVILLVACSVGNITGNVDALQLDSIIIDLLNAAVEYSRDHLDICGVFVHKCTKTAELILNVRTILLDYHRRRESLIGLHQDISLRNIQDGIDSAVQLFPVKELEILRNFLANLNCLHDLLGAIKVGTAQLSEEKQTIDLEHIQYRQVNASIEKAQHLSQRSNELDKCMNYGRLCVKLRAAIKENLWEISEVGENLTKKDIDAVTVHDVIAEFDAAETLTNTDWNFIQQEFDAVKLELERRHFIKVCKSSLQKGSVRGSPYYLSLHSVSIVDLTDAIAAANKIQERLGYRDVYISHLVSVAERFTSIRSSIRKMQSTYVSAIECSYSGSDMNAILKDSWLMNITNRACSIVGQMGIADACALVEDEWKETQVLVEDFSSCVSLDSSDVYSIEHILLASESMERVFVSQMSLLFYECLEEKLQSTFLKIRQLINTFQSKQTEMKSAVKHIPIPKLSKVATLIFNSGVFLGNLIQAKIASNFDSFDRNWKRESSLNSTSSILYFVKNLDENKLSMQSILRSSEFFELHPKVTSARQLFEQQIEDRISIKEMNVSISNPNNQCKEKQDEIFISESSINQSDVVRNRIASIGIFGNFDSKQVLDSFEIIIALRSALKVKNYELSFNIIDDLISNGHRNLEEAIRSVGSSTSVVIPSARTEFNYICNSVFNAIWLSIARSALLHGRITGKRGCLHVYKISWGKIMDALRVYSMISLASKEAKVLSELCGFISSMRSTIAGDDNDLDFALAIHKGDDIINIANSISATAIQVASTKIEVTTHVNIPCQEKSQNLNAIFSYLVSATELLRDASQSSLFHGKSQETIDDGTFMKLLDECDIVKSHCNFILCRESLERELAKQFILLTEKGLEVEYGRVHTLTSIIAAAKQQKWDSNYVEEMFWATILEFAISILSLLSFLSDEASKSIYTADCTLVPGTSFFAAAESLLQNILADECAVAKCLDRVGCVKRSSMPMCIQTGCKDIQSTLQEHKSILSLRSLLSHYMVIGYKDEIEYKVSVDKNLESNTANSDFFQTYGDEFDSFQVFAGHLVTYVRTIDVKTIAGQYIVDLVVQLTKFRQAVDFGKWYDAKLLADSILGVDDYKNFQDDLEVFLHFFEFVKILRSLEYSIYTCMFPTTIGWSLSVNGSTIAQNIGEKALQQLLMEISGTSELIDDNVNSDSPTMQLVEQYSRLAILTELSDRFIEITNSMRSGLWFDVKSDSESLSRELLEVMQIALSLEVDVQSFSNCLDPKPTSVISHLNYIKNMLVEKSVIPPYLTKYLHSVFRAIEIELLTLQLEYLINSIFTECTVTGQAGQLVIPKSAPAALKNLLDVLEKADSNIIHSCSKAKSGMHTAKILSKLLKSHLVGDLDAYSKNLEVLVHMQEAIAEVKEISLLDVAKPIHYDIVEIMRMDDDHYSTIFMKTTKSEAARPKSIKSTAPMLKTLIKAGSVERRLSYSSTSHPTMNINSSALASFSNSRSTDSMDEQHVRASLKNALGADGEVIYLRPEVSKFLQLLKENFIFESAYSLYMTALTTTPASGMPGEISLVSIDCQFLEKALSLLKTQIWTSISNCCSLLQRSVEAVLCIRQGQVELDRSKVMKGLKFCWDLLLEEKTHQGDRTRLVLSGNTDIMSGGEITENLGSISLFGGVEKQFIELASPEIELADKDTKQQIIISVLEEALDSPGLVYSEYPFNFSGIETEQLEKAYAMCNNEIEPACNRSFKLFLAAEMVLTLRHHVLNRDWKEMKKFVEGLSETDLIGFVKENVVQEINMAKKVMKVSYAVSRALSAYSNGALTGTIDNIDSKAHPVISQGLQKSIEAFNSLPSEWLTKELLEHKKAVNVLHDIRVNFMNEDWLKLYAVTSDALALTIENHRDSLDLGLPSLCLAEIRLAREHAAYTLSCSCLCDAIYSNRVVGEIGRIDVSKTSIKFLHGALLNSRNIGCMHDDVKKLHDTAEVLFFVRRAVLLGQWISQDCFDQYSSVTGPYFLSLLQAADKLNSASILASFSSDSQIGNPYSDVLDYELTYSKVFTSFEIKKMTSSRDKKGVTVRTVMNTISFMRRKGRFIPEVNGELDLVDNECIYRQVVSDLVRNAHSQGFKGMAGSLDVSNVTLRELEKSIYFAEEFDAIRVTGLCRWLLRDAKILLRVRECRLQEQWADLQQIIDVAEQFNSEGDGDLLSWNNNFTTHSHEESEKSEKDVFIAVNPPKLLSTVYDEVQLLRADSMFHMCLNQFATEMMKDENLYVGSGGTGSLLASPASLDADLDETSYFHLNNLRIDDMQDILDFTLECSYIYPSMEFDRLMEAEKLAVELRIFCRDEPNKSPQDIIHRIAAAKKRDKRLGVPCYVTILICDIAKMQNVLDFPYNLDIIQKEIVNGQRYLRCPVGLIDLSEVGVEIMQTAFQAAIPSLEIMGTEENHGLMKLAGAVIEMRKTLATGDLRAVMNVIISKEAVLNSYPVVADEVFRLRIELENQDASKLIELGLKNGRYLDVVSVAKMVQKFDRSKGDVHTEEIHADDAIHNSRRSLYLADIASRYPDEKVLAMGINESPDIVDIESAGKIIAIHKRRNTVHFLSQVTSSLNTLSRSVAVATKIVIKSAITQYFLESAFVILKLRECIISNRWDEVRDIVMRADHDLPATATEEINAVKEGLIYQNCISVLAKAFVADGIIGLPHSINCSYVSTIALDRAIKVCANMELQDISANIMMELGVRLRDVRHTFMAFKVVHSNENLELSEIDKEFDFGDLIVSLDQSIQHFFSYFDEVTGVLKATFQIVEHAPTSHRTNDSMQYSTFTYTSEGNCDTNASTIDWTYELWDSVCCAFEEVRRVRGFLRYSTVHQAIVTSIEMVPDSLLSMSDWQSPTHDAALLLEYDEKNKMFTQGLASQSDDFQTDSSFLAMEKDFFDIDRILEEALMFANESRNDDFHLRILQQAIAVAQEYMEQVHEQQRPEEIVTLSDVMKVLLAFRFLLASRAVAEDFLQLSNTVKRQLESGFLSTLFGKKELHIYLSISDQYIELKSKIVNALSNGRVAGHLDCIVYSKINCIEVETTLAACDKFVRHHGDVMSLGLQSYLYEASLILKLRTAVMTGNWTHVEELIARHNSNAFSARLNVAEKEFDFICLTIQFRAFKSSLFRTVVEFDSIGCAEYNFNSKEVDLQIFLDHFNTFISFASYNSPLLSERGKSISDSFIIDPIFTSFKIILRVLLAAVRRKQWYDKKKLHNNRLQLVSETVDPFLFAYFGLADADYFGNDKQIVDDLKTGREMTLNDESVLSVLISVQFEKLPNNVQIFLRKIRNALIDIYIYDDLNYYLVRGRSTYDPKSGNVLVSELFCKFLELVLVDSQKAVMLAGQLSTSFSWSTRTTQLLRVARLLHKCRCALISNDTEALIENLKSNNILQKTYPSFINGFHFFRNVAHNDEICASNDRSFPTFYSTNDESVGEICLPLAFDQREEIELFQSHSAAVITERHLVHSVNVILETARSDSYVFSTFDSNIVISDLNSWVSTLNIKDSFFSSRLQYHEEMLQLANVFTSCLKSALQGDEIKFRRQLQELMNATKCFPTFSRICSEQNEERLWEAMEIICLKRCLHPSVDITNGGGIIFVEPPNLCRSCWNFSGF